MLSICTQFLKKEIIILNITSYTTTITKEKKERNPRHFNFSMRLLTDMRICTILSQIRRVLVLSPLTVKCESSKERQSSDCRM